VTDIVSGEFGLNVNVPPGSKATVRARKIPRMMVYPIPRIYACEQDDMYTVDMEPAPIVGDRVLLLMGSGRRTASLTGTVTHVVTRDDSTYIQIHGVFYGVADMLDRELDGPWGQLFVAKVCDTLVKTTLNNYEGIRYRDYRVIRRMVKLMDDTTDPELPPRTMDEERQDFCWTHGMLRQWQQRFAS